MAGQSKQQTFQYFLTPTYTHTYATLLSSHCCMSILIFLICLFLLLPMNLLSFFPFPGSEKMFQGSKLADYTNKPSSKTNRQRLIHKAKMKSLRISVVIIIAFLICWTPYNVMMLIFMFWNPDKRVSQVYKAGMLIQSKITNIHSQAKITTIYGYGIGRGHGFSVKS